MCIIVLLYHLLSPQCGMITCQERFHAGLVIVGEKIDKRGLFIIAEHNKQSPFITSTGCSVGKDINYLLISRARKQPISWDRCPLVHITFDDHFGCFQHIFYVFSRLSVRIDLIPFASCHATSGTCLEYLTT